MTETHNKSDWLVNQPTVNTSLCNHTLITFKYILYPRISVCSFTLVIWFPEDRKPKLHSCRFLPWAPHLFSVGWGRRRDQPQDIAFTSRKGQVQGWGNNSSTGLFSAVLDAFYITSVVSCSLHHISCNPLWMVGFWRGIRVPMCSLRIGLAEMNKNLECGRENLHDYMINIQYMNNLALVRYESFWIGICLHFPQVTEPSEALKRPAEREPEPWFEKAYCGNTPSSRLSYLHLYMGDSL